MLRPILRRRLQNLHMISATFSGLRNPKTSPDSRELRMAAPLTGNLMEGEENTYYKRVWRRGDSLRINTVIIYHGDQEKGVYV